MDNNLNKSDLDFILTSLSYSKMNIAESKDHPDYKFKQKRLKEVDDVIEKVRALKKEF